MPPFGEACPNLESIPFVDLESTELRHRCFPGLLLSHLPLDFQPKSAYPDSINGIADGNSLYSYPNEQEHLLGQFLLRLGLRSVIGGSHLPLEAGCMEISVCNLAVASLNGLHACTVLVVHLPPISCLRFHASKQLGFKYKNSPTTCLPCRKFPWSPKKPQLGGEH